MALTAAQIGINLGRDILEGKHIRIDEDGFENFDDYFTETDSDDSDVEIVNRTDNVKLVAVKPAADDGAKSSVSPLSLSNFPSRKRLSFPVESDSCSNASEEVSYVQRVISKRGMKSLANTSTAESEDDGHQEVIVSKKEVTTAKTSEVSSAASNSNNKVRVLSKRGMKSFPEDEESFTKTIASSSTKESLSINVCDPPAEEPEITVKNGANTTTLSSSKQSQENEEEEEEENENDLDNDIINDNNNNNNENVLPEVVSTRKRKMTENFNASPVKSKESPRKVISAFGVLKPTVQTCFFDAFDTNLSLIEETEKTFRKSMKIVKKPENGGRFAEKNKALPSDVPKDKSSPLRHKRPQPSPTSKQTLQSKSEPEDKCSPLKRKKFQPSPTAKQTLNYKNASQDKSPPPQHKKPQTSPTEKQTSRNKSVAKDKTPPSRLKKAQPLLAAKHSLKSKIPSDVLKDKTSLLRHKNLRPSPIAKSTMKTKSSPEDKSSPLKHKKPQPSPTAKPTSKSKSVPSGVSEEKFSPSRNKKLQTTPTEKQTLKSKNHINGEMYITRSMRNKTSAVKPDNNNYSNTSSCFAPKQTYRYINNKLLDSANEHDIMYCCCLDSDKAFMGMISLKKGAYKQLNRSRNQLMFLVQFGKIKVRVGYKNMILTTGDSFMVPEDEIYSLRNKSNHDCGLIVTILK